MDSRSLQGLINSYILTTKQAILYCKEKIDIDKLAGAERVKKTISEHKSKMKYTSSQSKLHFGMQL